MKAKWFSTILILAMLVISFVPAVGAAPGADEEGPIFAGVGVDNLSHPKGDEQAALKAQAMEAQIQGKTNGKTHEVAKGQFVELGLEKNDRVFVIVAEFGNSIHPSYGGAAGPQHNQIAQPNRTVDNTTIWQADYNKACMSGYGAAVWVEVISPTRALPLSALQVPAESACS